MLSGKGSQDAKTARMLA